jgi:hypothetical protein
MITINERRYNVVPVGKFLLCIPIDDNINYQLAVTGSLREVLQQLLTLSNNNGLPVDRLSAEDGRAVRVARARLGESQRTFGARFGVTAAAVSLWELGKLALPPKVVEFVAGDRLANKTP